MLGEVLIVAGDSDGRDGERVRRTSEDPDTSRAFPGGAIVTTPERGSVIDTCMRV